LYLLHGDVLTLTVFTFVSDLGLNLACVKFSVTIVIAIIVTLSAAPPLFLSLFLGKTRGARRGRWSYLMFLHKTERESGSLTPPNKCRWEMNEE
jgi:hypothetical protein